MEKINVDGLRHCVNDHQLVFEARGFTDTELFENVAKGVRALNEKGLMVLGVQYSPFPTEQGDYCLIIYAD